MYNVGSGKSRRTGDILALLLRTSGVCREVVELRGGFKQDPIADITRIRSAVGWEPEIPIEETVEAVWHYCNSCKGDGNHP